MSTGVKVVLITVPPGDVGQKIADALVSEGIAACVNRVGPVHSTYIWQGELNRDEEELLIVKTSAERVDDLTKRVRELHPYELPEVIALDVTAGLTEYIDWVLTGSGGVNGRD